MSEALLELRDPLDAFTRLEELLAARGFFTAGSDGLVADVYLGYGLSQSIRRTHSPGLPEPCAPLPLLACRVGGGGPTVSSYERPAIGEWERTWTEAEYRDAVEEVRNAIGRGDVYQVNLVQHLHAPFRSDAGALAARLASLRPLHPRPFVPMTGSWSRRLPSSSSLAAAIGSGRSRSRERGREERPPSSAGRRRTLPST